MKFVFSFSEVKNANSPENILLLGNKGAQLCEMTAIGLPVPPGFTISTNACREFYALSKKWPAGLEDEVKQKLVVLEKKTGKKFGGKDNPLFVSVRSGSYVSMPGMMDTVLNIGMNDETVAAFAKQTGNERAAFDSYRRFINMFGDVVMGVAHGFFEEELDGLKAKRGVSLDTELSAKDLMEAVERYKKVVRTHAGKDFPQDTRVALKMAVDAVFNSWNSARAIAYRKINSLRNDAGTAVNVQEMVFGNMGNDSGTGVSFTRNPATGEKEHFGEFLLNAQGEDVVAGIRTPQKIGELKKTNPKVFEELAKVFETLEKHYKDLQDFEFTFEKGKLFLLQTRSGKRTVQAAVKIAVDMHNEGLVSKEQALLLVKAEQLSQLLHKQFDSKRKEKAIVIARGIAASPGAATGQVVFTAKDAMDWHEKDPDQKLILVRTETSPEDIEGMNIACGILTARGGATCVAGETKILTSNGFFTAKELFEQVAVGKKFQILSFDSASMKTKWKPIIATGKRVSKAVKIGVSQKGKANGNSLVITPDHKVILLEKRQLVKKEVQDVLQKKQMVSIIDHIPAFNDLNDPDYAYLAGAIFTDGYMQLSKRRGSVGFTQKNIEKKHAFISRVNRIFFEKFGLTMREKVKHTIGNLRGREIAGFASDFVSARKAPAIALLETRNDLVNWVLGLDEVSTLNFIAGAIDGDGAINDQRIQLYVGKDYLLSAVVVACLKLGIVPQVATDRTISNVQIVEKVDEILQFTSRVKFSKRNKKYNSKLFSLRQMFEDVKEKVDFTGIIKPAIKENKMFSKEKIIKRVFYKRLDPQLRQEIEKVIESDLRNYRAKKIEEIGEIEVFNFEVEAGKEIDKNFVVFTEQFTPVLVSNSHASVIARGMGKCCVAGSGDILVREKEKKFEVQKIGVVVKEGDFISLDGGTGEVFLGEIPLVEPEFGKDFLTLLSWADSFRRLKVRTNADTPADARKAREFGAQGIGLDRTEHMFFGENRITPMREMILSTTVEERKRALAKLLPFQREDFYGIFKAMDGLPVTIRLLDPPLHEFLPQTDKEIKKIAAEMGVSVERLEKTLSSLKEFNPMLGFRGVRLGIVYPEISEMQVRAIFEAAIEAQRDGITAIPEIMIPVVGDHEELHGMRKLIERVEKEVFGKEKTKVDYTVGVMIELPRACLVAGRIAQFADFFSFGTNDLTQTTFGYSRDDSARFIPAYIMEGILKNDPFQTLDQEGVGEIMKMAIKKGRGVKPNLKIGICGEHGGDPSSIEFCHRTGLDYVSCSPFRVPVARFAAAQAAIREKMKVQEKGDA